MVEVTPVIGRPRISLLDQDLGRSSVPRARPRLVRPGKAECEIGLRAREHLREWSLEYPTAGEPVVPVTEGRDPVSMRHLRLRETGFWKAKVIEAKSARKMW